MYFHKTGWRLCKTNSNGSGSRPLGSAHPLAVHSLRLPHSRWNQTQTLLGEQTIALQLLMALHCRHQYSEVLKATCCIRKHILGLSPCFFFDSVFVCGKCHTGGFYLFRIIFLLLLHDNFQRGRAPYWQGSEGPCTLKSLVKSSVVLLVWLSDIPITSGGRNRKN